jgi:hypothetical protein
VNALGEVIWSQSNYNTPEPPESHFSTVIKFIEGRKTLQNHILDCLLVVFRKEFLFGLKESDPLLDDIKSLPLKERKFILHNYYFCSLFAEARCPHQTMMERAYLIPQYINATDVMEYQNTCWSCRAYKRRQLAK